MTTIEKRRLRLPNSLGSLLNLEECEHGFVGRTDNGNFRILIYSPDTIRIQISKEESFENASFAAILEPKKQQFFIEEDNGLYIITIGKIVVKLQKNPVRFQFFTQDGRLINEDYPSFGTSWLGEQVTTYKSLQKSERFLGLGEKTGPLDKRGRGYQNWNTDSFAYHSEQDPLYASIPFYLGLHEDIAYGIFFDNTHKTHFNFGASNDKFSSFSADSGEMDYYFFYEGTVGGVIKAYADLTGYTEIPPLWSLGYQQCRYSYYPEQEVYSLVNTFRAKDIPADAIVFDIHYMDKYKIFSWDEKRFPDPKRLITDLKKEGFETVVMCDPGIKIEEGYEPYEDGIEKDVFIKYPDGEEYSGEVWPGWCHFPDFTKESTRQWWKEKMKYYSELGIEGYWNDMNEIATWGQTLPELMVLDFDGRSGTMREGRNIYGHQMAKSTFEAAKENIKGKRPFNLTRAAYSGIQRYAAVWTGDNVSTEEHMMLGVRMVNNMGLAGVPFAGYDVGGFAGNPSEHLFARWIQIGALSPFFRGHSMINSRDSEPWTFGEEVEEISRNYIKLRYKLMMYLYSAFYEASTSAMPVVRSLSIGYGFDDEIYSEKYENQYFFGPSIMVAPVESYKDLVKVYMPGESVWYELLTDQVYQSGKNIAESPIEQLPMFVKGGSVIPVTPNIGRNTGELGELIEYHIYNGSEVNSYTYYEDDGSTYQYQTGEYYKRVIHFDPLAKSITFSMVEGQYQTKFHRARVYFHGFDLETISVNDKPGELSDGSYNFIEAISSFDPFENVTASHLKIDNLSFVELDNKPEELVIKF